MRCFVKRKCQKCKITAFPCFRNKMYIRTLKPFFFFLSFYRNIIYIYIIGNKVTGIINSSYYATLINNNMATVSPIQSHNATRLIFVYKSDIIGVEVYYRVNSRFFGR